VRTYAGASGSLSAFRLDGKTAVITGAASGIGAATAAAFAEAGANVVLGWNPHDPHDVDLIRRAIGRHGGSATPVEVDVADAASVDALMEAAETTYGNLDIVVANAGIARLAPAEVLTDLKWRELMEVDLLGVFRCFRAALRRMPSNGWGRFLATSSISGAVNGWSQHVHYSAAKAGIVGLVRALALEVAGRGITVNAVAPGVIVTPQTLDHANSLGPDGLKAFETRVPVGRNGTPEDVAAVFLFLASPEAAYVTGQTIVVDGGATLAYL
jgi:3-oxoacyl-[acyl-carrier protein] reductase